MKKFKVVFCQECRAVVMANDKKEAYDTVDAILQEGQMLKGTAVLSVEEGPKKITDVLEVWSYEI